MVMDDLLCLNSGHLWLLSNQNPSHRTTYRTCLSKTPFFAANSNSHHTLMPQNKKKNWVLRVLQMRSLWKPANNNNHTLQEMRDDIDDQDSCDACRVDHEEEDDELVEFDKNSFSKLLSTVSLADARLYAKMAYLGTLSYTIPKIKLGNLLKRHKLRFVTSSLEKKAEVVAANPKKEEGDLKSQKRMEEENTSTSHDGITRAYEIAASYLHSHIFKSMKTNNLSESEVMLNAKDEMELEQSSSIADNNDLNSSTSSSPCEWFICDDNENSTRYFVIQGSESLASWQANLLFEPIQFEAEVDVIVHRGIYEAAKVVYEEILPRVHEHLQRHHHHHKEDSNIARICLTGHSLGGSLSLLINLMLLIRGQVPDPCCLLPVITFGAPWVMCGGDRLLHKLGLPRNHLQGITTHRDIVPRAFSCNFPTRVAHLLKAVNGNFRNHPCLNNQNVLYAPMGELLILQPDAKVSPSHELLPSGSGLYVLRCEASEKQTRAAHSLFLNTPHPLHMILSDPSAAYGSILRDHDVETYLKSIRSVIRQQLMIIRRRMRQREQDVNVMMRWVKEMNKVLSTLLDDGLKRLRNQMHLISLIMESFNWMHKLG